MPTILSLSDGGAPRHAEMGALVVLADSRRCLDLGHQRHPCVGLAIMERVRQCPRPTVGELGAQHRVFRGGGDSCGGLCNGPRPSHRARCGLAEITLRGGQMTWRSAAELLSLHAAQCADEPMVAGDMEGRTICDRLGC